MSDKAKKFRDLTVITLIYAAAYAVGFLSCLKIENEILKYFTFDIAATLVTFVFSVIFRNSSVYDAYWSLTPMVMTLYMFIEHGAFSPWQLLFLIVFNIWSLRLTVNWIIVTSGFSYEDWRYRKFRDENPPFLWFIINLCGIHYVPTLIVFAGMLPVFEIVKNEMSPLCLPGIIVMLFGIALEIFADREMHAHLENNQSKNIKSVCRVGLWNYSRHPNYLGEISVWTGTFLVMLPFSPAKWYYGIGFVLVAVMFNVISIPLMEKRQLSRRPEYAQYRKETSRLLLLPGKNRK